MVFFFKRKKGYRLVYSKYLILVGNLIITLLIKLFVKNHFLIVEKQTNFNENSSKKKELFVTREILYMIGFSFLNLH